MTGLSGNAVPNILDVFRVSGLYDFSIVVVSGTMNCGIAVSCKYPLCDYSNVVSFGHNELWLIKSQIASL